MIPPLTITGQAWEQVAGVTFPFNYAPAPKETLYPDQLQIQYDFNFSTFPSTVTGMSWSGVDANMSMNSLTPNMLSTLFINGGSYETAVTNWVATTTGTLLTNMAAGTVYYLQTLVTYTDATYNAVTAAPSLYSNPTAWFEQYSLGHRDRRRGDSRARHRRVQVQGPRTESPEVGRRPTVTPLLSLLSLLAGARPGSLLRSQEDEGDGEAFELDEDTSLMGTYREHAAETIILVVALIIIALVMLGYIRA